MTKRVAGNYRPQVFDVRSADEAMAIILTNEGVTTTQDRWLRETPHLAAIILKHLNLTDASLLLDFGAGIGRMSKALMERTNCSAVGADISPSMRALSATYVGSDRFFACHPNMLNRMTGFDAAISIWTIQHCLDPAAEISRIRQALKPGGRLFVLNNINRCVPCDTVAWVDDGLNVRGELEKQFKMIAEGRLDKQHVPEVISKQSFWWVGE